MIKLPHFKDRNWQVDNTFTQSRGELKTVIYNQTDAARTYCTSPSKNKFVVQEAI